MGGVYRYLLCLGVADGLPLSTLMLNRRSLSLFFVLGGSWWFTLGHADY